MVFPNLNNWSKKGQIYNCAFGIKIGLRFQGAKVVPLAYYKRNEGKICASGHIITRFVAISRVNTDILSLLFKNLD